MTKSLIDSSKEYVPKTTLNIADLDKVDANAVQIEDEERTGTNSEGKEFSYKVTIINGQEYRVPNSVLEEIQKALKIRADIKTIKVLKKGTGLNTNYSIEVLE